MKPRNRAITRASISSLATGNNKNLDGVKGDNDEKYAMLRMRYNLFRGGSDMARVS